MTDIPAGAKKPADRKKKKSVEARQAEADGFIDVDINGLTLRVPLGENVPLAAYMAFKEDDEMKGTALLLGEEQWAAFLATSPTIGDFAAIGQALQDALGN